MAEQAGGAAKAPAVEGVEEEQVADAVVDPNLAKNLMEVSSSHVLLVMVVLRWLTVVNMQEGLNPAYLDVKAKSFFCLSRTNPLRKACLDAIRSIW